MHTLLKYLQLVVSILLILAILVQNRSSGLTSGQTSASFQVARRGAEKVLFNATIVLAVLFVLSSLAFVFVR